MGMNSLLDEVAVHYLRTHDHRRYCCKSSCGRWEYAYTNEGMYQFSFGGYCFDGDYDRWHTIEAKTVEELVKKCQKEFDVQLAKPKYEEPF